MSFELWIGLRYAGLARVRRQAGKRIDRFVSFVAGISMAGIALGVAALIVVLSVMNGFQTQVRDRMLSVLPHIELFYPGVSHKEVIEHWHDLAAQAEDNPAVMGAAPFVAAPAMVVRNSALLGAQVRGIDPDVEASVSELPDQLIAGDVKNLTANSFGVLLGQQMARQLGVGVGDTIMVMAPQGSISPAGFSPRMRQVTVVGVFSAGHYEFDSAFAFMHVEDAARVFRDSGTSGIRLRIQDMQNAPEVSRQLVNAMPYGVQATNWTQSNPTWFAAVKTEKRMMFLILTLIVAVAAFNLLSSLVMAVKDKSSDIAILRTIGATPAEIARIFLVQGVSIGVVGTFLGVSAGALIAYNIDVIVPAIERVVGQKFLPAEVYLVSELPSNPEPTVIFTIAVISLVLSFLATLYPSWRAAKLQPAQVLRYD